MSQIRQLLLNQTAMDAIQPFLYKFLQPAPHKRTEPVEELCLLFRLATHRDRIAKRGFTKARP